MTNPDTRGYLIQSINVDLSLAYRTEEAFWRQRSMQPRLNLGDKNTCYFHASTRFRRIINKISVIANEEGESCYGEDQISKVITSYFQLLFTSQPGERSETVAKALEPSICEETNTRIILEPTSREIKDDMYSIPADKAPGPDGFAVDFFHSNWPTVVTEIVKEVQNSSNPVNYREQST